MDQLDIFMAQERAGRPRMGQGHAPSCQGKDHHLPRLRAVELEQSVAEGAVAVVGAAMIDTKMPAYDPATVYRAAVDRRRQR